MGLQDYDSLLGADMLGEQSSNGLGETGVVHMGGTGQGFGASGNTGTGMSHWSNLADVRNGPLFWLALGTILYLGLISLHVSAGIGRRR